VEKNNENTTEPKPANEVTELETALKPDKSSEDKLELDKKTKKRGFWGYFGFVLKVFLFAVLGALATCVILAVIIGFATYSNYAQSFKVAKIKNNSTQNVFYDKTGGIIYESYGAKSPAKVDLADLPDVVKKATLAAEDSGFYSHGAIDPRGLTRAALVNIKSSDKTGLTRFTDLFNEQDYSQGGSTITQQLVKNLYLTNERSFDRKLKEVVYSFELEKKMSKDQILEAYLNNVYYGEQALGIQNASLAYFGKPVNQLDLAEVTMLVGLPAAPTKLDPISGDFNAAKKRQEYVLTQMYNLHQITLEDAKAAANESLYLSESKVGTDLVLKDPFFVDVIKKELTSLLGEETVDRGGLSVYTSLDPKTQKVAEEQTAIYMKKFAYRKVSSDAIVILDNKTGFISALVGGADWEKSKINMATSVRQPGSSFKPIMYTAGLLNGYTAATRLIDKSVNFGGNPAYMPKNYDGSYHGNITLHYALANSLNVPAVEMTKLAGVDKVIETAKLLGISSITRDPSSYGLSIGLGSAEVSPFEMTRAFSVFANGGKKSEFTGIDHVVGNTGDNIYSSQRAETPVIDPMTAYIMANILSDNKARSMVFGTSNPLTLPDRKVAAKTGTTDDYADSWTIGFTPQYTVGVWMGNNDRTKMSRVSGVEGAAYIWQDVMKGIHKGLPAEEFVKPAGIATAWVNPLTGLLATYNGAPNILEYFVPGTEPKKNQDFGYLNQFSGFIKK
jgi:1A family penicillin-binding protein